MAANEFHHVSNTEADDAIELCKRAIPHNELIGRLLRNIYARLQVIEKENQSLKENLSELRTKQTPRG